MITEHFSRCVCSNIHWTMYLIVPKRRTTRQQLSQREEQNDWRQFNYSRWKVKQTNPSTILFSLLLRSFPSSVSEHPGFDDWNPEHCSNNHSSRPNHFARCHVASSRTRHCTGRTGNDGSLEWSVARWCERRNHTRHSCERTVLDWPRRIRIDDIHRWKPYVNRVQRWECNREDSWCSTTREFPWERFHNVRDSRWPHLFHSPPRIRNEWFRRVYSLSSRHWRSFLVSSVGRKY